MALKHAREESISSLLLAGDSALVVECLRSWLSHSMGVFNVPWKLDFLHQDASLLIRVSLGFLPARFR